MWFLLLQMGCLSEKEGIDTGPAASYNMAGQILQVVGGNGIEGVQVCQYPQGDCATSDADGQYQIAIEQEDKIQLQYTHSDYTSGVVPLPTAEEGMTIPNVSLIAPDLLTAQMSAVGLSWSDDTGIAVFSVSNGIFGDGINVPGIQVAISPATGDGPFYTNSLGLPTEELTETSDNGGGVWINLPAQTYNFIHQGIPSTCITMLGWGSPYQLQIPVVGENVTYVRIECADEE